MTMPAAITDAARSYLVGRPVVLRSSPRHGCCGGTALLPVVEVGPPDDPTAYEHADVHGVEVFVDPRLDDVRWLTIDLDGLLRWRRLVVRDADPRGGQPST
ncbi:CC/Se motif family (seleno)protein [soil metagenome]